MSNTIEFIDEFFGLLKDAYDMEFKPGPDRREAFSFASTEYEKGTDITEAVEAFVEAFGKSLEAVTLESAQAAEDLQSAPKVQDTDEEIAVKAATAEVRKNQGKKKAKKKAAKKVTKKVTKKAASKKVTKKVAKKVAKKTAKKKAAGTRGPSKAMQAYTAFIEWGDGDHDVAVTKAEADKEAAITAIQEALDTNRNNAGTYLSRFRRNDLPAK